MNTYEVKYRLRGITETQIYMKNIHAMTMTFARKYAREILEDKYKIISVKKV